MKKIAMIAGVFVLVVIIGIFLINMSEKETDVTKKQTKVGMILNGSCQDKNWSQSHYEGMEKSAEMLNLDVIYEEYVPEDETCKRVMEDMIAKGCEIIICNSYSYGKWEKQVAEQHPEIYFFHATGVGEDNNFSSFFGRMYQIRYLSGIVAGLQTETNEIGYVGAFPISEVNRGINAFTLGVRAVNKDAVVYVEWCNSWIGDEEAADATYKLLEEHDIDVLTMHTDSREPLRIAEEEGVWTIGYNMDNSTDYPKTNLTAATWQWQNFYEPRILECLQGKFQGKHYWEDINTGIVSLANFTYNVKIGIEEVVNKEKEKLQSGTFDVFYGPIKDNEGNLRVNEGESMTDEVLLNEFDWYVEGVQLSEKE